MAKFLDNYKDCLIITRLSDNSIEIISEEERRGIVAQLSFSSQEVRKIGRELIDLANQIEGDE